MQELIDAGHGVKIACTVVGNGPAVLMTHGFASSSHMFAANAAALAVDHRVITWDLRGHGASDAPDDPAEYTAEACLADMARLLDRAGADDAVLVGHSLGGYLSLAFHLRHPARVRGLVLVGTGPGFRKPDGREKWNRMAERFATVFEREGLATQAGSEEIDAAVHVHGAAGLARAARGILPQRDATVIDALPGIAVPALVVVGERDESFLGASRYMVDTIPGAELVVIAGAGHAPNVSHAAEFDAALRRFLEHADVRA